MLAEELANMGCIVRSTKDMYHHTVIVQSLKYLRKGFGRIRDN